MHRILDLSGGLASHLFHGDALPKPIIPIVFLGVALTSYWLRPADRRLASAGAPATAPTGPLVVASR